MNGKNDIKARLSGNKPGIDAEAIRALSELLAETGLTEIEIEQNGARIRVARRRNGAPSPRRRRRRPFQSPRLLHPPGRTRAPSPHPWWARSLPRPNRDGRLS